MELKTHTISLADGNPSCYYSTLPGSPNVNDGFKVFLNPTNGRVISIHEITNSKPDGFSVHWIDGEPAKLSFFVKNKFAYRYILKQERYTRGKPVEDCDVIIEWNENVVNNRTSLVSDKEGVMRFSIDNPKLQPAIKEITSLVKEESEALYKRANAVLGFDKSL